MTPTQSKIARAALGWSIRELATQASVRPNTVSNFESGGEAYASTVDKMQAAMEAAGVIFVGAGEASLIGGVGVRVRSEKC
jgi:transcriptional regulator with XRE-family HTH domain